MVGERLEGTFGYWQCSGDLANETCDGLCLASMQMANDFVSMSLMDYEADMRYSDVLLLSFLHPETSMPVGEEQLMYLAARSVNVTLPITEVVDWTVYSTEVQCDMLNH